MAPRVPARSRREATEPAAAELKRGPSSASDRKYGSQNIRQ